MRHRNLHIESLPLNINIPSSSNSKATYIIRWNSLLSRIFPMSLFESRMKIFDFGLNILSMRIMNWQNVHREDIVYLFHEGENATGIVLRGIVMNEPHTYQDWCTEDSPSRLVDLHVSQMMHPEKAILPDTSHLEEYWKNEEFKGHRYPILIDKEAAAELEELFNSYLLSNKEQFAVNKNNGVAITYYGIE